MKLTKHLLLSLGMGFIIASTTPLALAVPLFKCSHALLNPTANLISYFSQLLELKILNERELYRLIDGLKQNKLLNPISTEEAEIHSTLQIHRAEINKYLEITYLDLDKILQWANEALIKKELVKVRREKTKEETKRSYNRIEFLAVPPGKFMMGGSRNRAKVEVSLTHHVSVMSTVVTQIQWSELMGENPSYFVNGKSSLTTIINGNSVKMNPNNPVEMVSWWSAVVFANRLSEKYGLAPAYDLSKVKFNEKTRAENGTLQAEEGSVFQINSPNGNIYEASGFRLPTEAEQEYLLRGAGKSNGNYHFSDPEDYIGDYAWFQENSSGSTQPVGILKPLIIGGGSFYDLHGNVSEWGNDFYDQVLSGGKNPVGPATGEYHLLRGGNWQNAAQFVTSWARDAQTNIYDHAGFRLVRTLDPMP